MSKWLNEKKMVMATARKMYEKGLVVGTAGNISLRLSSEDGGELLAITPTSKNYELLDADDIQILDFETNPVEGNLPPSIETRLHIGIYRARKDVHAVIHTHSVFASAVAVTGLDIPPIMDDQVACLGGSIKVAKYAPAGSQELEENVIAALGDRNAVLLANHGVVGTGRSMREAFIACELIEKTAGIYLLALAAGKVNRLPPAALKAQKAIYRRLQSGKM